MTGSASIIVRGDIFCAHGGHAPTGVASITNTRPEGGIVR